MAGSLGFLALGGFALVCFWQWRRWKAKACKHKADLAVWKEALHAVAFESVNAVNAIRANLLSFREVNPGVSAPQHLNEIERGADRIAAILRIAADPEAWRRRTKAKPAPAPSSEPEPASSLFDDSVTR